MTTKAKDIVGAKYGMWLFLYSEIMLFAGLFVLYAAYFREYQVDFINAGKELSLFFGVFNTVILLTSSFTVAASITALRKRQTGGSLLFLLVSIVCALIFLVNKYFEWSHKFAHDIYPNSATLSAGPLGENMFFGLYYVITGLHGLHVLGGVVVLSIMLLLLCKGSIGPDNFAKIENTGLYWHLVDLIWIFLFPLFYLIT